MTVPPRPPHKGVTSLGSHSLWSPHILRGLADHIMTSSDHRGTGKWSTAEGCKQLQVRLWLLELLPWSLLPWHQVPKKLRGKAPGEVPVNSSSSALSQPLWMTPHSGGTCAQQSSPSGFEWQSPPQSPSWYMESRATPPTTGLWEI